MKLNKKISLAPSLSLPYPLSLTLSLTAPASFKKKIKQRGPGALVAQEMLA